MWRTQAARKDHMRPRTPCVSVARTPVDRYRRCTDRAPSQKELRGRRPKEYFLRVTENGRSSEYFEYFREDGQVILETLFFLSIARTGDAAKSNPRSILHQKKTNTSSPNTLQVHLHRTAKNRKQILQARTARNGVSGTHKKTHRAQPFFQDTKNTHHCTVREVRLGRADILATARRSKKAGLRSKHCREPARPIRRPKAGLERGLSQAQASKPSKLLDTDSGPVSPCDGECVGTRSSLKNESGVIHTSRAQNKSDSTSREEGSAPFHPLCFRVPVWFHCFKNVTSNLDLELQLFSFCLFQIGRACFKSKLEVFRRECG